MEITMCLTLSFTCAVNDGRVVKPLDWLAL